MSLNRLACLCRRWVVPAVLLAGSAIVSARAVPATQYALEDGAALQTVNAFHKALAHGNAAEAASLLDDHAVVYEEGGAETSKSQYVASHLPADIEFLRTVREVVLGRVGHEDADHAWVATQGRLSGRYKDKPVDRLTTETMVLLRTPSGWRIVHIHWSSRAADGA